MSNLVLKVEEYQQPKNDDILVYNENKGCWVVLKKMCFLSEIEAHLQKIEKEKKELESNLKNEIIDLKNDLSTLAKIIKENIK